MQVIQGGGMYMRMQDGQFDGGLNSFFSPSLATFINRLLLDSKKLADGIVERRATGLADYPDEILCVRVRYFNLAEDVYKRQTMRTWTGSAGRRRGNTRLITGLL